jgi:hypothetical protein
LCAPSTVWDLRMQGCGHLGQAWDLSDEKPKTRFSHTALHYRRMGIMSVCLGAVNSSSRTHLLENECPSKRIYGKAEKCAGALVHALRPSAKA